MCYAMLIVTKVGPKTEFTSVNSHVHITYSN